MAGPTSLVFYLDYTYGGGGTGTPGGGVAKGILTPGTAAFDARTGPFNTEYYSSDIIPQETLAIDGSNNVAHTAAYLPVRPGTVSVALTVAGLDAQSFVDDGNGTLIRTGGTGGTISAATINYTTGAIAINYAEAITVGTVTYRYDSEANDNVPQLDLQLTSSPIMATERKLRARWSLEAAQNLNALHGLDAEAELVGVMAEVIKFELDREIINDLFNFASAGNTQWDKTTPPNVSYVEHKLTLVDAFIANSNQIFSGTRRGQANWIVSGVSVCDVIESLPTFSANAGALQTQANTGVIEIGTLNNRWTIFKDPFFPATKWVMGFKGNSFLDTGYVYAPYIPIYTTPTIVLDDFLGRKGIAEQHWRLAA